MAPTLPPTVEDQNQPRYFDSEFRDHPVRAVYFREYLSSTSYEGWVKITVWQNIDQRQQLSLELAGRALFMLLVILLATAVIVWYGVTHGLKPLRDLQQAIERRSPDDLSPIKRAVPREVSRLVAANNHLFGQVRESIIEKDAFIANAAHQLRNPIAGLLSQAEAAERTNDNALLRARTQDVAEAARRMARLTQQLLSMERISQRGFDRGAHDNGPGSGHGQPQNSSQCFDLGKLVEQTLAHCAVRALQQGVELSLTGETQGIEIQGQPTLIGEALDNLIDNALRYACRDQRIAVAAPRGCQNRTHRNQNRLRRSSGQHLRDRQWAGH